MKNKYYTPDISEFVEGFKYQIKSRYRIDIIDFAKPKENIIGKWKSSWDDRTTPSLKPTNYPLTIKFKDGSSCTFMNSSEEDPLGFIKIRLKNKTIRAVKNG